MYVKLKDKCLQELQLLWSPKTPAEQLITDMLECVRKEGAEVVATRQFGLNKMYFDKLFLKSEHYMYIHHINYNYPEVDEENICLFHHL